MDGQRFDRVSKLLARRASRRQMAAGGAGTAFAGLLGLGARRVAAHQATPAMAEGRICTVPFEATVRQGPDTGQAYAGLLVLQIGAEGAIDAGVLVQGAGDPIAIVGQTDGRAINLLFSVAGGHYLYGVGVAATPFDTAPCPTLLGGPFVGPTPGDSGDWASCCCPSESNSFTCPEELPPCRRCADIPPPPPQPEYERCAAQCTAGGGTLQECSVQCLQG